MEVGNQSHSVTKGLMKLPVKITGRHRGKALQLDTESETITLLGQTDEKLGTVPWDAVIEYITGYVEEARVRRVRNYPRSPIALKIRYQASASKPVESLTAEIGGGGVFIESGTPLRVGTEIAMEFLLPDYPTARVHAKGKVAWVRPKPKRSLLFPGMGVQFTEISEEECARLLDLLKSLNQARQGS